MVMPLLPAHISLHSQRELALILGNCDNKRQCSWYCDGYAASLATTRMVQLLFTLSISLMLQLIIVGI